jgi:hypothetical protein
MIKFIFISILVILFLRLVAPVLFRFLLGMFIKKSMRNGTFFTNMNQPQRPQPQPNGNSSNGRVKPDIKIDYMPDQPNRNDFKGGEYVDYEEVK